jgi:hypothetical protein
MKIDVQISGHGPVPGVAMAQYTVMTDFDGPLEAMTMSVLISNKGDEASRKLQAIARAKELARLYFPLPGRAVWIGSRASLSRISADCGSR